MCCKYWNTKAFLYSYTQNHIFWLPFLTCYLLICMHACQCRHRDLFHCNPLTKEENEHFNCQLTQKSLSTFSYHLHMHAHVFIKECTCCEWQSNLAKQWGIMRDAFLRTLTPFDPAQPKKKKVWGSECRLADSGRELYNPQIAGLVKNRNSDKKANNKVVDGWRLINAMSPLLQRQIKNKYLNLNLNALGCC